jgi:hypothetical protein
MLEVMMGGMDAIGLVICYGAMVCMYLLMGVIVLWGIYLILKVLFGKDDVTPLTANQKSCPKSGPIVYDWSDADEAQSRAVRAGMQAHEDSCRLHDMAVRDTQEAHAMACDMHNVAMEMHNDFACNSCDPWF